MYFDEFEKYKDAKLNKKLLWEFNVDDDFDWQNMRKTVVERVIDIGKKEDYYAIFNIYGGVENVKKIIKELPYLSDINMNFVCVLFDIKKEQLKCYIKKQLIKEHIHY